MIQMYYTNNKSEGGYVGSTSIILSMHVFPRYTLSSSTNKHSLLFGGKVRINAGC